MKTTDHLDLTDDEEEERIVYCAPCFKIHLNELENRYEMMIRELSRKKQRLRE